MPIDPGSPLSTFLNEHIEALREGLFRGLRAHVPVYRTLPEDQLRQSATTFIDTFVSALMTGQHEQLLVNAHKNLEKRYAQGLPLENAVLLTTALRYAVLHVLRPALEGRVEGAFEGLLLCEGIFKELDTIATRYYKVKLDEVHRALTESEERHRRMVELSPDGVAVLRKGRILYVNPAGARMLGAQTPADLAGVEFTTFVEAGQREAASARLLDAEQGLVSLSRSEETLVQKEGESLTVELLGTSIALEGGRRCRSCSGTSWNGSGQNRHASSTSYSRRRSEHRRWRSASCPRRSSRSARASW